MHKARLYSPAAGLQRTQQARNDFVEERDHERFQLLGRTASFLLQSEVHFLPLTKHSSQVSVQRTSCGMFPLYVVTWNPNFPVGETESRCSFARLAANCLISGTSSSMSWKSQTKKCRSRLDLNV